MNKSEHKSSNYKQLKTVSVSTLIDESMHTRYIMRSVIAIAVVLVLLIIWASFSHIEQVAVSHGELVPAGKVQTIQHLEGGVIDKILVKNGAVVKKGELLIKMNPNTARAELSRLRSQETALIIDSQRLNAYLKDKPANLVAWGKAVVKSKYNHINSRHQIEDLLKTEKKQLHSQYVDRKNKMATLKAAIKRNQEQVNNAQNQLKSWHTHLHLLQRELNMYIKLKDKGIVSKRDYLAKLREMNKAKADKLKLESEIAQFKQVLAEAKSELRNVNSSLEKNALEELGTTNDKLLEIQHQIEKYQQQLKRINIVAPVAGVIKGIDAHQGSVIQPGGGLLELVPIGDKLVAQTNISQRDIGHIRVGDTVNVKILTYDFARYGSIKGHLTKISASSYSDDVSKPSFYKVTVAIDQQYLQDGKTKKSLLPGMVVQADIVTGERTILSYLLHPINKASNKSFNER